MRARTWMFALFVSIGLAGYLVAFHVVKPTSASTAARETDRGGWPNTRVGELARGWVEAFSTSEEAMKTYLAANMAPKDLAKRDVPQRIERYRDLRKKYGKLELASVVKSLDRELTVKLMASDGSRQEFTFTAQDEPPFKLSSVAIKQSHFDHFGFGH